MKSKTFSIILPVYNGGLYVKQCVSSILQQTLDDFNLIVLDNCSSDGTSEWLQCINDQRVEVHRSEKFLSIEENWKRALWVEKNEFMTLIGHDDVLAPDYLEEMNHLIVKHPNASLFQTHFQYIDAKGNSIRYCKPMDAIQLDHEFLACLLTNQIDLLGTGFMMRSKDYEEVGGIPTSFPNLLFADMALFIDLTRLSYKATSPEVCFSFRVHQSTTSSSADLKLQEAFGNIILYLFRLKKQSLLHQKIIERYSILFITFYCKGLAHRMMRKKNDRKHQLTVEKFITTCMGYAQQLSPSNPFNPNNEISIRFARVIDRFFLTRQLFFLFKKIYRNPIF